MRLNLRNNNLRQVTRLEDRCVPAIVNWDGGAGTNLWSDAQNWDTNKLPQSGDDVVIESFSPVVFDTASGTANLKTLNSSSEMQLTGGTLSISNAAVFKGALTHIGGVLQGAGSLLMAGGMTSVGGTLAGSGMLTIPAGSTWNIDATNDTITLNQKLVTIDGSVVWTGFNPVFCGISDWFINGNGSFDIRSESIWKANPQTSWRVMVNTNAELKKPIGNGTTDFGAGLVNYGTVRLASGNLDISHGFLAQGPEYGFPTDRFLLAGQIRLASPKFSNNNVEITLDGPQAGFVNANGDMLDYLQNNYGTLNLLNGRVLLHQGDSLNNRGLILVDATSKLNVTTIRTNSGVTVVDGTLSASESVMVTYGTLRGNGNVIGNVTNDYGWIEPGNGVGILTINGDYTQSNEGTLRVDFAGSSTGQSDRLRVNGFVSLGGLLRINALYSAKVGDSFVIIDNDGTDAITGTFKGIPEGGSLVEAGIEATISYQGGDGNDVTLTVAEVSSLPPPVASVSVNNGAVQRSAVTQLKVTFSEAVTFANYANNAMCIRRTGPGTQTGDIFAFYVVEGNSVNISQPYGNSFADGNYELTLYSSKIVGANGNLDGNGDGTPGDDLVFTFHRLFGDANGDRKVTAIDFAAFRTAYGAANSAFDFNNDGIVNSLDWNEFRIRYGSTI